MLALFASISSLLLGISILLVGIGLLGTLLGIRAELEHFSDALTGVIMSSYFVGFAAGTFLCPKLIHRVGHIRAYAAMGAVASSAALLHVLFLHPVAWMVLRAVTGFALVALYMVIESWLNVLAPNEHRGRLFALYTALTLFAMALGQYLILAGDTGSFELFVVVAMLLSLALLPVVLTPVLQPTPVEAPSLGLRKLYDDSPLGTAGALLSGVINGAFWGMGPVFAHQIGLTDAGIAAFMSAVILGGALLQWPIGHLSDLRDRRSVIVGAAFAAAALALAMATVLEGPGYLLFGFAFLYGGFAFTLYSLSVAHVNDLLEPGQVLNATQGLLLMYGIGAGVGPAAAGLLMERAGPASLLVLAAVLLVALGSFGLHRMRRRGPIPQEEQGPFVPMVRTSQVALEMDPRTDASGESEA